jgi:hypothetical protein
MRDYLAWEIDFMSIYYCRICWNDRGWRFPSGPKNESGYAGTHRFGHEEWLFNFLWKSDDGYKYAFLQPVGKVRESRAGESLDLVLWTIRQDGERCEAGRIKNCKILTPEESMKALAEHKRRSWFRQMQEDVESVGGGKEELNYLSLFNVRFRPEDATVVDPPIPFPKVPIEIKRYSRYHFVKAHDSLQPPPADTFLEGQIDLPPEPTAKVRGPLAPASIDPQEKRLQRRLMELLRKEFGKEKVRCEGGFGPAKFDLVVRDGQRILLIEMKAYADARRAVREALGQILEYTFFYPKPPGPTQNVELFIVAPALMDEKVSNYLELLRNRFAIPVKYCSFSLADPLPSAFL